MDGRYSMSNLPVKCVILGAKYSLRSAKPLGSWQRSRKCTVDVTDYSWNINMRIFLVATDYGATNKFKTNCNKMRPLFVVLQYSVHA